MTTLEATQERVPGAISFRAYIWLALILPIFAIAPLFYPGYIQTHGGFVLLWNVADLRANLGDLTWLPHVAQNFDLLRSDGLLPYYLAGLSPLPPITAVKIVFSLGWLLGSVGMFLWLRSWLGEPGALVAALVYTYLPYQIVTVYVRGAWGETLFWGLLPWAILGATFLVTSSRRWLILPAALLWGLLGLSHLGLALWTALFVAVLLLIIHPRQAFWSLLAVLLGVGGTVLFYLNVGASPRTPLVEFGDHFLYPFQLFSARWGFGVSRPGWDDGLSLQLGLAAIGLTIMAIVLWQRRELRTRSISRTDRRLVFFLSSALILIFLQFGLSMPMWQIPVWPGQTLAGTLTYPWQLLGLAGLCLAILAGSVLWLDRRLTHLPLFGTILLFVVLSSYRYLEPQFIQADQYQASGPQALLGSAQLALIDHEFSVVTSGNTAGLGLGETAIPLAVHGPLQGNDLLQVNITWQPLRTFSQDWKVFVHLVDAGQDVVAQFDGPPLGGDYPTSQWIPGELIKDSYPILIPAEAPAGPYQLFLGFYDEATSARLPVSTDSAGRVMLDVP